MITEASAADSIDETGLIADIERGMDILADAVEANNIVEGRDTAIHIPLGKTDCIGRLAYTHINGDPQDIYTLTIGAIQNGKDDLHMTYDFMGTKEEFCKYVHEKEYSGEEFAKFIISCAHGIID